MEETGAPDSRLAVNPLDPSEPLRQPPAETVSTEAAHPPQPILPGDSATTKAEKVERHGLPGSNSNSDEFETSPAKRMRLDDNRDRLSTLRTANTPERQKGVAHVKAE